MDDVLIAYSAAFIRASPPESTENIMRGAAVFSIVLYEDGVP